MRTSDIVTQKQDLDNMVVTRSNHFGNQDGNESKSNTTTGPFPSVVHEKQEPLSYCHIPGSSPMLGLTTGDMIDLAAMKFGDLDAIVSPFQGITKTFKQLKQDVDNLSRGLISIGLKRGDRFAVWSPNSYESYLCQLAGWKAGLIVVCINAALQSRELLYALNKVGVRAIFIAKVFRSQDYYEILTKSVPEIKSLTSKCMKGQLKSPHAPELEFIMSMEANLKGTICIYDVLEMGANNILSITPTLQTSLPSEESSSSEDEARCKKKMVKDEMKANDDDCSLRPSLAVGSGTTIQFDNVSTLFFTSGTTGSPKAVMATHHNLVNNGYFVGKRLNLHINDRICLPVPLFHGFGCQIGIFAALTHGATVVLPSYGYDPKANAQIIQQERCSYFTGTPTMLADLLRVLESVQSYDFSSLKAVITAGAICTEQLINALRSKLPLCKVISNYGMTESGCTFLSLSGDDDSLVCSSVGFPGENLEVKLVNKKGNIVPVGNEGELCVRGYGITIGYWGEPEETSQALEPSGWFHTGDLFTFHESGHGQIVGRIKEMVNRGGENVYPKEIEEFLRTHPKIEDAQVFGVPDTRMGEEPAAWIALKENQMLTPEDVKAFCKGEIAHFKIPKYIWFRDDFPRTPLGKVQKFRMREESLKILNKT